MAGKLIVIEGPDGVGKTTQTFLLKQRLLANRIPLVTFKEPGDTETSELLRQMLLSPSVKMSKRTQTLVFFAARSQLLDEKIDPALALGTNVLLDRYIPSTLIYQNHFEMNQLVEFHNLLQFQNPDLYIFLDSHDEDRLLLKNESDRYEADKDEVRLDRAKRYRELAEILSAVTIDTDEGIEQTHHELFSIVINYLTNNK